MRERERERDGVYLDRDTLLVNYCYTVCTLVPGEVVTVNIRTTCWLREQP